MTGCAIHPLPEDVTGIPTAMIARKIRCEARTALKDNLVTYLKRVKDPAANRLGVEFENGRPLNSFRDSLFHGKVKTFIKKFENSAIAYNFAFDMTEVNNLDGTLGLTWPFTRGTGSAAITAGVDRSRENTRTFTVTDTFIDLFTTIPDRYCSGFATGANYIYPLIGTIGVDEMIRTFVELSLFDNLSSDPSKTGPPTMGDTITFTTKLSGSAAPTVTLTPVGRVLQVANGGITGVVSRTDVHKVIVALALPTQQEAEAASASVGASGAQASAAAQTTVGFLVHVKGTATNSELAAAKTIEQIIIRFELARGGVAVVPTP
jgi:hypothetical protein